MRSGYLALTIALTAAAPAFADGDQSGVPNPFTDQQSQSGNITSVDKGVSDFTGPIQGADPSSSQPVGFGPPPDAQNGTTTTQPDTFYQSKKPGQGRE
jgi:hypothetical protein